MPAAVEVKTSTALGLASFEAQSSKGYEFVPFEARVERIEIRRKLREDGSVHRYAVVTVDGSTAAVTLWDRDNPIPEGVAPSSIELGNAVEGGTPVTILISTDKGAVRVPKLYVRLKRVQTDEPKGGGL